MLRRVNENNREIDFSINQLSIGGCFGKYFEEAEPGADFQLKFPRGDGEWMLLVGRIRYRYLTVGVGVEFIGITEAEQQIIAELIMENLWETGQPVRDPFALPITYKPEL